VTSRWGAFCAAADDADHAKWRLRSRSSFFPNATALRSAGAEIANNARSPALEAGAKATDDPVHERSLGPPG